MVSLVGLCGYAGSGKDTAALCLTDRGWKRRAFADKLKEMALQIRPWIFDNGGWQCLETIVFNRGWERAKKVPDVRRFLQRLGVEVREVDPDFWVRAIDLFEDEIVITDVRFPNEAQLIAEHGGILIRIVRPGVGPVNSHSSENDLAELAQYTVVNDGSVEDLHRQILEIVNQ